MGTYGQWLQGQPERQARKLAERQVALEQARADWVGCRVWYVSTVGWGYAWVTGIDDGGFVGLHLEDVPYGFPDRVAMRVEVLGSAITRVE